METTTQTLKCQVTHPLIFQTFPKDRNTHLTSPMVRDTTNLSLSNFSLNTNRMRFHSSQSSTPRTTSMLLVPNSIQPARSSNLNSPSKWEANLKHTESKTQEDINTPISNEKYTCEIDLYLNVN